jgi:hypothetical protein
MKVMICSVTFDTEDKQIKTYGDYVKSLSNEELVDWMFHNMVSPAWQGKNYWNEVLNREINLDEDKQNEES